MKRIINHTKIIWLFVIVICTSNLNAIEPPKWLYTPSIDGYVGAVGHATVNEDKKLQKKIALIDARAKYSEMLKIKIANETKMTSSSDGNHTFLKTSLQTSDNLVRNTKIRDEFVDENGGLYIWLVGK